jgi:branched-chain amino acid transport system ATP-binding protein
MLSLRNVAASYGRSQVLFDMNLDIGAGEVVTLLGRNGMGKTTTIRAILGLTPPQQGEIVFAGERLAGRTPVAIARLGIGLVPEGRQVFPTLSVKENLVATAANRLKKSPEWSLSRVYALFPRLGERENQRAATLSGGEQQMLAVGRALMTNPSLLILDEATEGLAPVVRAEIWHCLEMLKAEGQSILIVDKNLGVLKRLASRHFAIEKGRTVWSGSSADLERDAEQIHRYVGV